MLLYGHFRPKKIGHVFRVFLISLYKRYTLVQLRWTSREKFWFYKYWKASNIFSITTFVSCVQKSLILPLIVSKVSIRMKFCQESLLLNLTHFFKIQNCLCKYVVLFFNSKFGVKIEDKKCQIGHWRVANTYFRFCVNLILLNTCISTVSFYLSL